MTRARIGQVATLTNLGDWQQTWEKLLSGQQCWAQSAGLEGQGAVSITVAAVMDLDRSVHGDGEGPATRLTRRLLHQLSLAGDEKVYLGSNHSEAELVQALLGGPTAREGVALLYDQVAPEGLGRIHRCYGACASGLHALAAAIYDFADGEAEHALVIAVDALSAIETMGFARVGALSRSSAEPFQARRDGLTIGEGAVGLTLSAESSSAVSILGLGLSCDAFHPTDPEPSGAAAARAIRAALQDARCTPSDIGVIVAHGTGTQKGDAAEASAFAAVWGDQLPLVTSIKGRTGHLMGAAGLLNVAIGYGICTERMVPPAGCVRDGNIFGRQLVVGNPREVSSDALALCLASGFGGNNVAVVMGVS